MDKSELGESDNVPFEEILRRVKGQARAKKSYKYAQKGRSGIRLGVNQANGHRTGQGYETWGESASAQANGGDDPQELNSAPTRQGEEGKAKGKGKDGNGEKEKGEGNKGGGKKRNIATQMRMLFCGGKHWAS